MSQSDRIMIIDDDPAILLILKRILMSTGNEVISIHETNNIVELVNRNRPDLILLDVTMPGIGGFEVCELLKQVDDLKDIPVIFLSGNHSSADKIKGFHVGGVDYITKPFNIEEVHARVKTHLRLRSLQNRIECQKLVEDKIREISEAQSATIFAMAKLAEDRDEDTGEHLKRVREYCRMLAEDLRINSPYEDHISIEFIDCIQHAAPLHDIGKIAIPDCILQKPGKLTPEEFNKMKKKKTHVCPHCGGSLDHLEHHEG